MNVWSGWYLIDIWNGQTQPGVYQYRFSIGGKPVPIRRFLGTDAIGTLVFVCTGNLGVRWDQSRRARMTANGSSTMNLLYYLERYSPLLRLFPGGAYEYRYTLAGSEEEAETWESLLLKQYMCQFGELPPLNSALPNRYGGWAEAAAALAQQVLESTDRR